MITYEAGGFGLGAIPHLNGSVLPKAFAVAVPNGLLGFAVYWWGLWADFAGGTGLNLGMQGVQRIYEGYTLLVGFVLVFRAMESYTRFMEGAEFARNLKCRLIDCTSSMVAMASHDDEKRDKVIAFQHYFVRLVSLLHAVALQRVAELHCDSLEIMELKGIDPTSLEMFATQTKTQKPQLVMLWMNRLMVQGFAEGIFSAPPPVLNRAFLDLSDARETINGMKILPDFPFPFPYAQMITAMLIIHWVVTPLLAAQLIYAPVWIPVVCFCVTFCLWSVLFISFEMDNPFGDDNNDLPVKDMQKDFNRALLLLLHPSAQFVPSYDPLYLNDNPRSILSWDSKLPWYGGC
eukprot:TRINITY_DN203_c2_g1_i1.p1 TRINITY_DN203_c2_g1~~TRINITY_DN203_c2_g1_i1.p1  ORF type:complete len:347 (+),score=51.17 TRINITY_DN203_c2_g1_i1:88-1128(+)